MIKASSFVHPGSSNFSITGVGFKPQWGIFLASNLGVEDTWVSPNQVVGSIGFAAVQNNEAGQLGIHGVCVHEIWDELNTAMDGSDETKTGGVLVSSPNIQVYVQSSSNAAVDGWSVEVTSFDANGFSCFSVLTSGASGQRVYYLVGDEDFEEVASGASFVIGSAALNLGWQPQAFFGIGTGLGTGGTAGIVGRSQPTVLAGDWGEYTDLALNINAVWRGIHDPDINTQFWLGGSPDFTLIPLLELTISGGTWFSSQYTAVRTDTTFLGQVTGGSGFSSGTGQLKNFILGKVDSIVGSFTPSTTVGVPTQVDLPFTPEAVVFFSPQEHRPAYTSQVVQAATGWGWCTETDQALLIYGGHWNPPNPYQTNGFQSRSVCWVGNCLDRDTDGTVGTEVNMGSAQVNAGGFTHTTTAHAADPGEVWPVLYWAFAPVTEEVPQFFRRV